MKVIFFASLFWVGLAYSQVEINSKTVKVNLEVGADRLFKLDFTPSTTVDVVNSTVAGLTLVPQRKEINIKALAVGKTNLRIRDEKGNSMIVFALTVK